jgi:hypothetical protein
MIRFSRPVYYRGEFELDGAVAAGPRSAAAGGSGVSLTARRLHSRSGRWIVLLCTNRLLWIQPGRCLRIQLG